MLAGLTLATLNSKTLTYKYWQHWTQLNCSKKPVFTPVAWLTSEECSVSRHSWCVVRATLTLNSLWPIDAIWRYSLCGQQYVKNQFHLSDNRCQAINWIDDGFIWWRILVNNFGDDWFRYRLGTFTVPSHYQDLWYISPGIFKTIMIRYRTQKHCIIKWVKRLCSSLFHVPNGLAY